MRQRDHSLDAYGFTTVSNKGHIRKFSLPLGSQTTTDIVSFTRPRSAHYAAPNVLIVKSLGETDVWNAKSRSRRFRNRLVDSLTEDNLAVSTDGTFFATVGENQSIAVRWTSDGTLVCDHLPQIQTVSALEISPDNRHLVVGGSNGVMRIWDLAGVAKSRTRLLDGKTASMPQFSPDGQSLLVLVDGQVHCWSIGGNDAPESAIWSHRSHTARFNTSGSFIASVNADRQIELLDPVNGQVIRAFKASSKILALEFSSGDGDEFLAIGLENGDVLIWDLAHEEPELRANHGGAVVAIAFHPQCDFVATASGKTVKVWRRNDGMPVGEQLDQRASVHYVSFSPDGAHLLTVSEPWVTVWDWNQGHVLHRHRKQIRLCNAIFARETGYIFAPTNDDLVGKWHIGVTESPELIIPLKRARWIYERPTDRRLVVSGGSTRSGYATFWDSETLLESAPAIPYRVSAHAQLSPDGAVVAIASRSGRVDIADLSPTVVSVGNLQQLAELLAGFHYEDGITRSLNGPTLEQSHREVAGRNPSVVFATVQEVSQWAKLRATHERQLNEGGETDGG